MPLGVHRRRAALGATILLSGLFDHEANGPLMIIGATILVAANAEHVVQ
jgi:hypothetical protein